MKHYRLNPKALGRAAAKAGMHRQTAAKYLHAGIGPTEMAAQAPRRTRRRPDPLAGGLWQEALTWLVPSPEIDAKVLFEHLIEKHPEWAATAGKALRTFQRRVKQWRELEGPAKTVSFAQVRIPGACAQFDWTRVRADDYTVRIDGEIYEHMLAHFALPYSNWEWAVPCISESSWSLRRGVQEALWQLGGVPPCLQTDQSSSATHQIERDSPKRDFNEGYVAFCAYLKTTPRAIHTAQPDQNGDIEAANGHLKRRIRNHLALRGSCNFATLADYTTFITQICQKANARRADRLSEELPLLRSLPARRYPETQEVTALVTEGSTIRVNKVSYSVPSRLIGTTLTVQVGERQISVHHGHTLVLKRATASPQEPGVNYRHIIDAMLKKPGAFRHYVHRDSLFPDVCFRQAYEVLKSHEDARADKRYLQLLKLAAEGSEALVSQAIGAVLREAQVPLPERIARAVQRAAQRPVPATQRLAPLVPTLQQYDSLLNRTVSP